MHISSALCSGSIEKCLKLRVNLRNPGSAAAVFWLQVSGIGAADAALALTAVLSTEACGRVDAVLSVGCSGAHREDLGPGDVVLGTANDVAAHHTSMPSGAQRGGEPVELIPLRKRRRFWRCSQRDARP